MPQRQVWEKSKLLNLIIKIIGTLLVI